MAKCKSCSQKSSGVYGLGDANINLLAGAAAGALVSRKVAPMLLDKVEFLSTNPLLKDGVKIAGGFFLAGMENEMVQGVGIGMVADAAANLIGQYLPANMGGGAVGNIPASSPIAPQNQYQLGTRPTLSGMDIRPIQDWQDSPAQKIAGQEMQVNLH